MVEPTTDPRALGHGTTIERKSNRELVVTRSFDAPAAEVFRAWSQPDLFRQWWVPEGGSVSLVGCEMDVRAGGKYRLEFGAGEQTMAFHGKYIEVVSNERIVWTNEEDEQGAVTTVTFEDRDGKTFLTFYEMYPSEDALNEALGGAASALQMQMDQLEAVLPTL